MSVSANSQSLHKKLNEHAQAIKKLNLYDLFLHKADRTKTFSLKTNNIFIDYSKNFLSHETLALLNDYADSLDISGSIQAMFNGEKINITENRAVLHTALRSEPQQTLHIDNENIIENVHKELDKIDQFVKTIHTGEHRGWTGKKNNNLYQYWYRWF